MRFKKLSTLGFVFAFGVACSDSGTGPADDFDPTQSAADLEAISAAFDSDVLESLAATGESFSAVSGVPAMAVQMQWQSLRLDRMPPLTTCGAAAV